MDNRPIAIIDSGLGGLAIAQTIWQQLPYQSTIYLADHEFFPYGERNSIEINRRLISIFNFILAKNCKAVVIACNTITKSSIKFLRDLYSLPIIGTEPAIKPAIEANLKETIVVWATPNTINHLDNFDQVKGVACKTLAFDIENKSLSSLTKILTQLIANNPKPYSALVLGCTHYILIKDLIKKLLPSNVIIIEPSQAIALQTEKVLKSQKLLPSSQPIIRIFYTTAHPQKASKLASFLLKQSIIFKACSI